MGRYTGLEQIKGQRYADWCDTLIQDKPLNSSQSDENMYMYISMNSDLNSSTIYFDGTHLSIQRICTCTRHIGIAVEIKLDHADQGHE